MIWLIVLSTALIALWGSSDHWHLSGLRRRMEHALHFAQRDHSGDQRS